MERDGRRCTERRSKRRERLIGDIRGIGAKRGARRPWFRCIFKCIFHAINFGPRSKFVIPLSPRRLVVVDGRSSREHYHLYEILCASLCIVIIQPLFPGRRDGNKASSIQASVWTKVTILIKEILPPAVRPGFLFPSSTSFSGDSAGFHLRSTSRTAR